MNDPLRTTAGDGNSQREQVAELFRTELTPDQIDGTPAAEAEETAAPETALDEPTTEDQLPDESLDGEAEEETESETENATPDGDVEIHDLSSLAEQIGVDLPFLYDLEMTLSDDGTPVKLGEIKDRLQEQGRLDTEREKLQTERSAFEQQRATELQSSSQMTEELVQAEAHVAMLANQYQSTDWAALEENDAGKAALYKQDLTQAFQNAQQQAGQVKQKQQAMAQQNMQSLRVAEESKLVEHIPTWRDQSVRKDEIAGIMVMAAEYGYQQQDIANVMDHRAVRMMRDLYLRNKELGAAGKAVEKVRKVPRAIKPGGPQKRVNVKKKALQETIQRAADSKDSRVKTRAIADLLSQTGAVR